MVPAERREIAGQSPGRSRRSEGHVLDSDASRSVRLCPQRRLEEAALILAVGLQMAPLGPFVPGIDEDEALRTRKFLFRAAQGFEKPMLVIGRRPVEHDYAAISPTGGIVP